MKINFMIIYILMSISFCSFELSAEETESPEKISEEFINDPNFPGTEVDINVPPQPEEEVDPKTSIDAESTLLPPTLKLCPPCPCTQKT